MVIPPDASARAINRIGLTCRRVQLSVRSRRAFYITTQGLRHVRDDCGEHAQTHTWSGEAGLPASRSEAGLFYLNQSWCKVWFDETCEFGKINRVPLKHMR